MIRDSISDRLKAISVQASKAVGVDLTAVSKPVEVSTSSLSDGPKAVNSLSQHGHGHGHVWRRHAHPGWRMVHRSFWGWPWNPNVVFFSPYWAVASSAEQMAYAAKLRPPRGAYLHWVNSQCAITGESKEAVEAYVKYLANNGFSLELFKFPVQSSPVFGWVVYADPKVCQLLNIQSGVVQP